MLDFYQGLPLGLCPAANTTHQWQQRKTQIKQIHLLANRAILGSVPDRYHRKIAGAGLANHRNSKIELAKLNATIVEKVSASGTVQPVIEVKIAPEVSGEIRELLIEKRFCWKESDAG